MGRLSRWYPLALTLALLWACLALLLAASLRRTDGHLVYALDDPYIHMAMAKNVARHGVWGVSSTEFSPCSSSLLWTSTLSLLYAAFGAQAWIPFVLNGLLATLAVAVTHRLFRDGSPEAPGLYVAGVLVASVFATPLPALVFAGQEHIAHAILNLAFLVRAAQVLTSAAPPGPRPYGGLMLLAALLTGTRYEGLFPVGLVAGLLVIRRQPQAALLIAAAGAAPVAVHGVISMAMGWFFLPSSVLLKASRPDVTSWHGFLVSLGSGFETLWRVRAVMALVAGALVLLVVSWRRLLTRASTLLLGLFVVLAVVHMHLAQPRSFWLYRYEAYLVLLGLFAVGQSLLDLLPVGIRENSRRTVALAYACLIAAFLLSPVAARALDAARRVPLATANIYEQSYQMARFVRRYYDGTSVALSDIGAVTYFADVRCLDLVGLASRDIAIRRLNGDFFREDIEDAARDRGTRIAILHDYRFERMGLPRNWVRAGTWTIPNRLVLADATLSFYATNPDELPVLKQHLREFAAELPRRVSYRIE